MGASSMLQQASGQGRVHMHIAAHHRRLGGNNRDRVSPFSQHSSCSSDSFDDPAFASVPSHELSYMPPAGSEWCPLVSGTNTPLQPSAGVPVSSYAYAQQELGTSRRHPLDPSPLRSSSNPSDVSSPIQHQQQQHGSMPFPTDDGTDLGIYIQEQLQHISPARGNSGVDESLGGGRQGSSNLLGGQRTGRLGSDTPVGLQGKENGEVPEHRLRE
ncbi:hypothetical protein Pmar_PMAR024360 [Perkinsus marinus ATCC 50983]|uniref:Uncharacterized protein n=1 Tax=Perkinsus marinus (strain ATCC 50983 / TXsc) TaxID=423536 RepID=C5LMM2_PERM5|nr:hypothetical protein Pmar_PMAR024360 [Perkinsus marinus ATCC 50983]EER02039.1 hypothetical protein Pmar_PMAR024360 [Perkinsus marinus ATCC 50983]|eukprot:XP_002769321.1 hypothetical protein Pmar_PMAR024360 [Perkinsus marinus ATCC 50983]